MKKSVIILICLFILIQFIQIEPLYAQESIPKEFPKSVGISPTVVKRLITSIKPLHGLVYLIT